MYIVCILLRYELLPLSTANGGMNSRYMALETTVRIKNELPDTIFPSDWWLPCLFGWWPFLVRIKIGSMIRMRSLCFPWFIQFASCLHQQRLSFKIWTMQNDQQWVEWQALCGSDGGWKFSSPPAFFWDWPTTGALLGYWFLFENWEMLWWIRERCKNNHCSTQAVTKNKTQ